MSRKEDSNPSTISAKLLGDNWITALQCGSSSYATQSHNGSNPAAQIRSTSISVSSLFAHFSGLASFRFFLSFYVFNKCFVFLHGICVTGINNHYLQDSATIDLFSCCTTDELKCTQRSWFWRKFRDDTKLRGITISDQMTLTP